MKAIINGRAIVPDTDGNFFIDDRATITFDDRIRAIGSTSNGCEVIDAEGNFVAPDFIILNVLERI